MMSDKNLCIHCKWSKPHPKWGDDLRWLLCDHPGAMTDGVAGELWPCNSHRNIYVEDETILDKDGICGHMGRWWEPKEREGSATSHGNESQPRRHATIPAGEVMTKPTTAPRQRYDKWMLGAPDKANDFAKLSDMHKDALDTIDEAKAIIERTAKRYTGFETHADMLTWLIKVRGQ